MNTPVTEHTVGIVASLEGMLDFMKCPPQLHTEMDINPLLQLH